MGLKVKTKGSFSMLTKKLKNIDKDFNSGSFLEDTAKLLNSSIQIRVQKRGEGTDGRKMTDYSDKYAAFKKNTGRKTSYRDLTFSGKMFQSLTTSKGRNKAKMFFGNAESNNKAAGNDKRTPFFGLGERERKILRDKVNKLIRDL